MLIVCRIGDDCEMGMSNREMGKMVICFNIIFMGFYFNKFVIGLLCSE